jgi:hypothetical protein
VIFVHGMVGGGFPERAEALECFLFFTCISSSLHQGFTLLWSLSV